ncbi:MAG TPA: hypothetical protein VG406_23195 [Isosphaeraceae bacterium]|jgi:hypothetical protein|nr:hypothetical protein [Isosphaeraceae bacterium]
MDLRRRRADEISGAVWLIGLGVLLITGYWWPGILFVIGAGMIVQALAEGRAWYASQGALWMFGLGIWFATGAPIGALFIVLGISALLGAIFRPPPFAKKPPADNYLE